MYYYVTLFGERTNISFQIASERGQDTSSLIFLKNPSDVRKAVALKHYHWTVGTSKSKNTE
nr:hypothetical protein [Nostoc sp. DedQUE02]